MSHPNSTRRRRRRHRARFATLRPAALLAALGVVLALEACNLDSTVPAVSTLTPAAMALVLGGAQVGAAGNTLPIPVVVRVTDASGAPVSDAPVGFTPVTSSGSVGAPFVLTDSTGSAGALWTLGTAIGADSLTVSVVGAPDVTVTATAIPGVPASITIVSGDAQTAPAGATLGTPLVLKVADQFGNAVPGANVRWSNDATGVFTSASAVTGADGMASATYTLGAAAGLQHVTVVVSTDVGAMQVTIIETGT